MRSLRLSVSGPRSHSWLSSRVGGLLIQGSPQSAWPKRVHFSCFVSGLTCSKTSQPVKCIRPPASSLKCDWLPLYLQMESRCDFGERKQRSPGNEGCSSAGLAEAQTDPQEADVLITGEWFCHCVPASQGCCLRPYCVLGLSVGSWLCRKENAALTVPGQSARSRCILTKLQSCACPQVSDQVREPVWAFLTYIRKEARILVTAPLSISCGALSKFLPCQGLSFLTVRTWWVEGQDARSAHGSHESHSCASLPYSMFMAVTWNRSFIMEIFILWKLANTKSELIFSL